MANYPFAGYQHPFANQYQQQFQQQFQPAYQPQFQPQQQAQPAGITGRLVNAEAEVTPGEVPTDGTVGYYPSADGNVVWAKTWNNQGGINTVEYVRKETPTHQADPLQPIIERFEGLADRLSAIETALIDLKPKPRTRKAADE